MDWFRWWHGSVTDPKFQLIARRANTNVANVIAIWAAILESASNVTQCDATKQRGDATTFDCDGVCASVYQQLIAHKLIKDGVVVAWEKRQPKREDSSAARTKEYRERKKAEALANASDAVVTQRDAPEKIRLDKNIKPKTIVRTPSAPSQFESFWNAWPKTQRKVGKAACLKKWKIKGLDQHAESIIAHVEAMKLTKQWQEGFDPSPITYLNQERWKDDVIHEQKLGKPWFFTLNGVTEKAKELAMPQLPGETPKAHLIRLCKASNVTEEDYRRACIDNNKSYYPLYPVSPVENVIRKLRQDRAPLRESLKRGKQTGGV
jgi:hypothetical protein